MIGMQVYRLAFQLCKSYDLPMTQAAVLTGDLIGSTEAGPEAVDRAMRVLSKAAMHSALQESHRFTRSRGDGWQAIVIPANRYLRISAYFLAKLRQADLKLQTRIGIGVGSVTSLPARNLSNAAGTAFLYAGYALDEISGSDRLEIQWPDNSNLAWHQASMETLTYFSGRWSVEQAEAIAARLLMQLAPLNTIAEHLNITRQALSSRLAVAGEKPIMAAIRATEATL